MSPPILGKASKYTRNNIKRANKNTKERRDRKRKKTNLEKLSILEEKYLPLPTVSSVADNLSLDEYSSEKRPGLKAYQFTPTNLGCLEGVVVFYEDGTADIVIVSTSWEVISRPIMNEIRAWGFDKSPFQIKDKKDTYALFFSIGGISVKTESQMEYEDAFRLLSKYFTWIYDAKLPDDTYSNDLSSRETLIKVERFLT